MNYKSLSLAALLLPSFSYGVSKSDARIKELTEAQFQTTLELKSLMKQIRMVSYDYLISDEIDTFLDASVEDESEKPENKHVSKEELEKRERKKAKALKILLRKALSCASGIDSEVEKTFFKQGATFSSFQAIYLEGAVEELLLSLLEEKAKNCLKRLLVINKELKSIQS